MAYSYHISIAVVSARALRNKVIERPVLLGQFPHAVEANVALPGPHRTPPKDRGSAPGGRPKPWCRPIRYPQP